MQKIDRILDIDRRRLGASGYVFASPDIVMALRTMKKNDGPSAVVVGRPLDEKAGRSNTRKFSYLLCADAELVKEPVDAGPERLRGVVWNRMEKPKVTPVNAPKKPESLKKAKTAEPMKKTKATAKSKTVGKPQKARK
jgi:hypothetical protein